MEKILVLTLDMVVEEDYDLDLIEEIAEDPDPEFLKLLFKGYSEIRVAFTPEDVRSAKRMLFESAFEGVDFEELMQDSGLNQGCYVRSAENGQRNGSSKTENIKFCDAVTQGLLHPDHVGKADDESAASD